MKEEFRHIDGYDGYLVSNLGNVLSLKRGRNTLSKYVGSKGYERVCLFKDGKGRVEKVHSLVARTFIPNPENKRTVNHKDGDKTNNHLSNLEWATYSENHQHAYDIGIKKAALSKLSDEDVLQIRSIYEQGWALQKELAEAYNVTPSSISQLVNYNTYRLV